MSSPYIQQPTDSADEPHILYGYKVVSGLYDHRYKPNLLIVRSRLLSYLTDTANKIVGKFYILSAFESDHHFIILIL
jgi:hypothetical protein